MVPEPSPFPMYYIGVRDEKMEKDGKNKSQHLGFLSHNILGLATLMVYKKLKTLALIEAEKSVIENFIGEKEKWTNKGNGMHQEADSLLTMQQVISNICTKFQNPRCSCS